jgi:hypothetical protein
MNDLTLTAKFKALTDKARAVRMNVFLVYVFEDDFWACSVIHPDHREEDIRGETIEDIVVNLEEFFKEYGNTNNVALIRPKK